jgi:hypothetical protein
MPPAPAPGARPPLRVGVATRGAAVPAAYAAAVRELLAGGDAEVVALVLEDPAPEPRGLPRSAWELYQRWRPPHRAPGWEPVELPAELAGAPRVPAKDVTALRELRLDVVLRWSSASPPGGLAASAVHGIWAFERCDERAPRAGLPGFWEIHDGAPATGAILQRLGERPGEGVVLRRCFVNTKLSSHRTTLATIAEAMTHMPAAAARDLRLSAGPGPDVPAVATAPASPRPPSARATARFLARMVRAWVRGHLESIFLLERWHVGIVRAPIHSFLAPGFQPAIDWLPQRKGDGFLADPFVVTAGERRTVLMEEWDDGAWRGRIVAAGLGEDGPARPALESPTHLAYPYVFEHEGRVFCTPENARRRAVILYELEDGGTRFTERATLLEDVGAVDPTLVRHDGRWWLFCADIDDEAQYKLYVWHASELLGPWEPHPANPVKADVRSSRPAGTPFLHAGELYRPAQDSAAGYGSAVVLNRVTRLSPTQFAEEPVARFPPPRGSPFPHGAHTLAAAGDITAVDGKRNVLALRLAGPRTVRKVIKHARRVRSRR